MKKSWVKPSLVMLYRGKPEEAVLDICKITHKDDFRSTGPKAEHSGCSVPYGSCASCELSANT